MSEDLTELLSRVETATGSDVRLDGDIAVALGVFRPVQARHERVFGNSWHVKLTGSVMFMAPAYTASLDAALALVERVLPGAGWLCGVAQDHYMAEIFRTRYVSGVIPRMGYAEAPTPALALLAALLRAKASS